MWQRRRADQPCSVHWLLSTARASACQAPASLLHLSAHHCLQNIVALPPHLCDAASRRACPCLPASRLPGNPRSRRGGHRHGLDAYRLRQPCRQHYTPSHSLLASAVRLSSRAAHCCSRGAAALVVDTRRVAAEPRRCDGVQCALLPQPPWRPLRRRAAPHHTRAGRLSDATSPPDPPPVRHAAAVLRSREVAPPHYRARPWPCAIPPASSTAQPLLQTAAAPPRKAARPSATRPLGRRRNILLWRPGRPRREPASCAEAPCRDAASCSAATQPAAPRRRGLPPHAWRHYEHPARLTPGYP